MSARTQRNYLANKASAEEQNEMASGWMKRGIALLEEGQRSAIETAVHCFDRAIELRSELPLAENPGFRYDLAAGWMNRADALMRLDSTKSLKEALRSYDEALRQLQCLPLGDNPQFRERFAIAWLNRGTALESAKRFDEALSAFDEAIGLLSHEGAQAIPRQKQLLGCMWMNRGNALLQTPRPDSLEAHACCRRSLCYLAQAEHFELIAAEASLKARHVLCRSIAVTASQRTTSQSVARELFAEATDAVDDGLALVREWEARGTACFREMACALFRFGAFAFQKHQPQFLVEFIVENLDCQLSVGARMKAAMHDAATDALRCAFHDIQKEGQGRLNPQAFAQFMEKLTNLSMAEKHLHCFWTGA